MLQNLNTERVLKDALLLSDLSGGLSTEDTTTPLSAGLIVLLSVVGLNGGDEVRKGSLVSGLDIGQSNNGSSLLVNKSSETSLTLDDGVRNTHLSAESRDEDNELDGVDVVGNKNKLGLLVLDEGNNVVETVLNNVRLLRDVLLLLALSDGSSLLGETLLLLSRSLGTVVVQELESLSSSVLVQDSLELSKRRRDLETEVKDLLLSLETNVTGPLDETRKVSLGLDGLADTEVAGSLLNQGVLGTSRLGASLGEGGRGDFLSFGSHGYCGM